MAPQNKPNKYGINPKESFKNESFGTLTLFSQKRFGYVINELVFAALLYLLLIAIVVYILGHSSLAYLIAALCIIISFMLIIYTLNIAYLALFSRYDRILYRFVYSVILFFVIRLFTAAFRAIPIKVDTFYLEIIVLLFIFGCTYLAEFLLKLIAGNSQGQ